MKKVSKATLHKTSGVLNVKGFNVKFANDFGDIVLYIEDNKILKEYATEKMRLSKSWKDEKIGIMCNLVNKIKFVKERAYNNHYSKN